MTKNTTFLEQVVGSKAKVRILSFLYTFDYLDYSISEIANDCGISWNTSSKHLKYLHKIGLVRNTRTKGNQNYYIGIKNEIYTAFILLEDAVLDYFKLYNKQV
jgi:predicted transcriptional regulator